MQFEVSKWLINDELIRNVTSLTGHHRSCQLKTDVIHESYFVIKKKHLSTTRFSYLNHTIPNYLKCISIWWSESWVDLDIECLCLLRWQPSGDKVFDSLGLCVWWGMGLDVM